jgi:hypothetical protein
MIKTCSICRETKEISLFYKNKSAIGGCGSYCRKCRNIKLKRLNFTPIAIDKKTCNVCKIEKQITEFSKCRRNLDGYDKRCRSCAAIYLAAYYKRNSEKLKQINNSYYHTVVKSDMPTQRAKNRKRQQERLKTDVLYKLKRNLRNRLYYALQNKVWKKNTTFSKYIGLQNHLELKAILEKKFLPGMTWENYGKWEIDHIIPLDSAKTPQELFSLCHYTNLQPLWKVNNIKKSNKL